MFGISATEFIVIAIIIILLIKPADIPYIIKITKYILKALTITKKYSSALIREFYHNVSKYDNLAHHRAKKDHNEKDIN